MKRRMGRNDYHWASGGNILGFKKKKKELKTGLYYSEMFMLQDVQLSVWAGSEVMAEEQLKSQC